MPQPGVRCSAWLRAAAQQVADLAEEHDLVALVLVGDFALAPCGASASPRTTLMITNSVAAMIRKLTSAVRNLP